jgi:hypothetical protein
MDPAGAPVDADNSNPRGSHGHSTTNGGLDYNHDTNATGS